MLVWIDLEMTGLDPSVHAIVEAAALVTDDDLHIVAEGPDLVIHQPEPVLQAMDPWCVKAHGESGLIDKVRESTVTVAEAERQLLEFVRTHCERQVAPLAGNSIHVDRKFLQVFMPELIDHVHYRNVDVTTVKELVRRWYPEEYGSRPRKRSTHRALDDIRESIEELRFYREKVFRP
jgi:oligoribonuclease